MKTEKCLTNNNISDILNFRMITQAQATAIVRQRGQLTIPDFIREAVDWIFPGSVVSVSQTKNDEIVIKPHTSYVKTIAWDKLWKNIELARSYQGKYKGSLSRFVIEDREHRR